MPIEHWDLHVSGRVQGVGYRQWVVRTAKELGVNCLVRNLPDGSVHVQAEGEATALARLARRCEQGPPLAVVAGVRRGTGTVTGISGTSIVR